MRINHGDKMKITSKLILIILILLNVAFAQQRGIIMGRVVDAKTGENIIGANVLIEGTSIGAATDLEGKYVIRNIDEGIHTLIVSFISYAPTKIQNVTVEGDRISTINVSLQPDVIEVQEVVVTAKQDNSYESALLNLRKKSSAISDGISAEQIKRAPDATSADALKRITGISLVDNKFVFIRGTSERYSNAQLNNSILPSTEPDKKSFAFDLLPSNLMDNTIIIKSFTPDSPGDFSSGLVKINTVDFPSELTMQVNLSYSYSSTASLKTISTYQGGKTDWLGVDDGTRALPFSFPSKLTTQNYTSDKILVYAKSLNNIWSPNSTKTPLNNNFSISFGDGATILGQNFGFISAISYRSNYSYASLERNEYEASGETRFSYKGTQSRYSTLWGGLFNFNYKLPEHHILSFKNTYSHTSDDEVAQLNGIQFTDGNEQQNTALRFVSRSVYSGQFAGEHYFQPLNGLKINWQASFSSADRDEPDYRRVYYSRVAGSSDPFVITLGFQPNLKNGGRFYSSLNEKSIGGGIDFILPISEFRLKFGGLYDKKNRIFSSRLITVIVNAPGNGYTDYDLLYLPLDKVFSPENFRKNGFSIDEYHNGTNNYSAGQSISAGYLMFELPINLYDNELRIVGGARIERSNQTVNSRDLSDLNDIKIILKKTDVLPSLNFIYKLSENTNLRLAYSQTVNRPELRELAPFAYYDFGTQTSIRGNENLNRAFIKNYDFRFELFPGIGELVSVSFFYKSLTDAIEQVVISGSALGSERTFMNSKKAVNYGFELDARFSLSHISDYLSNFFINGNYSWIKSKVDVEATEITIGRKNRPLQGQSPYVINLGLSYIHPNYGTSVNLLYNRIGARIIEVATLYQEDVIEEPRDLIDLVITQPILSNLELKFTAKDLLHKNQVFKQGDKIARVNSKDSTVSLGLSYKL
jgi:outer membrane receptor protein involved in Fe transport